MPYSSSESIFVNPGICDNYGTQVQKFYDDEIESYVHRSGNGRQNIRTGGCSSRRGSRNLLSKMLMFSSFSSLLSSIPSEVSTYSLSKKGRESVRRICSYICVVPFLCIHVCLQLLHNEFSFSFPCRVHWTTR